MAKEQKWTNVSPSVEVTEDGDYTVIRFQTGRSLGPSKSGKTNIVATTGGNITLPSGVTIGVNAYRK